MSPPEQEPSEAARHARLKDLFAAVCDLPSPQEVAARLVALHATPAERDELARLLAHDDGHTTHLSAPVSQMVASVAGGELRLQDRLGAWTLVGELGQGGMGRVFEAERSDGHYQQSSAIKVLRGFSGEAALAQLTRERQILATLNHPHIARLLDGGTTPAGNPYLVMERVDGLRIDEHVRRHGLAVAEVLALFRMVCEAVAYAHRRLVVHCDIKPGNVLVDEHGSAKLLDFGIAQLEGRGTGDLQAMTPRYASPEQLAGAPATAATDIYSLGRTLETLLELAPQPLPRATELRAIVACATAETVAARYADVPALIADLRRFHRHEPLAALTRHRPAWHYTVRKLLRRRWRPLAAAAVALSVLLGFSWRLVQERDRAVQAERAARAAQAQAVRDAGVARRVSELLVSLFDGADPRLGGAASMRAADLLDRGRERVAQDTGLQPEIKATMTGVLARVYDNLGSAKTSIELLREAVRLERALPQLRVKEMGEQLDRLADALSGMNLNDEAIAAARESLAFQERHAPADSLERARALSTLGWVLEVSSAHWDEAERHHQEALRIRRLLLGAESQAVASSLNKLGTLAYYRERYAESERYLQETLALKLRLAGPGRPEVLNTQLDLARVLDRLGRRDEAVRMVLEVLAQRRVLFGADSREISVASNAASVILRRAGRAREAAKLAAQAIEIDRKVNVPQAQAFGITNRGRARADLGDPDAERDLRQALVLRQQFLSPEDPLTARSQLQWGRWLLFNGRAAEAQEPLRQAKGVMDRQLPAGSLERVEAAWLLAEASLRRGDAAAARGLLAAAALDGDPARAELHWMGSRLAGQVAQAEGAAAEARQRLGYAVEQAEKYLPALHADLLRVRLELAELLLADGQPEAAATVLAACRSALDEQHPGSALRARAAALRARL